MFNGVDAKHHVQLPTPVRALRQHARHCRPQLVQRRHPHITTLRSHPQGQLVGGNGTEQAREPIATHQHHGLAISCRRQGRLTRRQQLRAALCETTFCPGPGQHDHQNRCRSQPARGRNDQCQRHNQHPGPQPESSHQVECHRSLTPGQEQAWRPGHRASGPAPTRRRPAAHPPPPGVPKANASHPTARCVGRCLGW
ncbi:hypothetical protein ALP29_201183 [Pseudomonas syringae pv. avii]|uniref:Uncharacterized protein n=1 Tax=Pseudomonas syringae pv. avii TaxID=663959 RepID=A0A3M5UJV1_PSESX|nr:hypothetical protein ALP29_201183 [Pseudomonas syringae pv. avii]